MVIKSFLRVLIKAQMLSAHNWTALALHSSYAAYIIKGKVAFHEFTPAELCGSNFSPMRTENCIPGTATPAAHCTRRNALPLYVCVCICNHPQIVWNFDPTSLCLARKVCERTLRRSLGCCGAISKRHVNSEVKKKKSD
jgi:hypothetical protein